MKWEIASDCRQEYWKKIQRKGTSSNPNSPAGGGKDNPNFRGPNGQNLGYDRSYEGQFPAVNNSPKTNSPSGFGSFHVNPHVATTPERPSAHAHRPESRDLPELEDSPLPSHRPRGFRPSFGLSDAAAAGSPPTLSSSYMEDGGSSMITPAPQRHEVRLAPPSTLVPPSKFMFDSSPVGPGSSLQWKSFMMGSTPARPGPDISPLKTDLSLGPDVPSSSPPPVGMASPSKATRNNQAPLATPVSTQTLPPGQTPASQIVRIGVNGERTAINDDDEEEMTGGGFDLAR